MTPLRLELPFPPSMNHAWRRVGNKTIISKSGRQYREDVAYACLVQRAKRIDGRLGVHILLRPPNRVRRDVDNFCKQTLDALTHAGVWEDDSQIDDLHISRGDVLAGGLAVVTIRELEDATP